MTCAVRGGEDDEDEGVRRGACAFNESLRSWLDRSMGVVVLYGWFAPYGKSLYMGKRSTLKSYDGDSVSPSGLSRFDGAGPFDSCWTVVI